MKDITIPVRIPADHPALLALGEINAPTLARRRVQRMALASMIDILLEEIAAGTAGPYAATALENLIGGQDVMEFCFRSASPEEALQAKALFALAQGQPLEVAPSHFDAGDLPEDAS